MSDETSISFNDSATPFADAGELPLPPPEIDLAPYLAELDDTGLTDDQKAEFLATLVSIIWHFVDLGFRGDISQLLFASEESEPVQLSTSTTMETPSTGEKDER